MLFLTDLITVLIDGFLSIIVQVILGALFGTTVL